MNRDEAQLRYLRWLSRADPQMYSLAMAHGNAALGDYEEGLQGWADTIVNAAVAVGGALLAKKQSDAQVALQKKQMQADALAAEAARQDTLKLALIDINTKRAAQGQPPVDANGQIIPSNQLPILSSLPAVAGTSQYRQQSFFESVPTWAWLAGAGVIVLLVVKR